LSLNTFGQDFPGKDVQLLVGRELKVKELAESLQKYGYNGFFIDEKLNKKYACCESYNSKYNYLAGKIFKVISYEPYTDIIGSDKFKLKLENSEIGIIFFDYDPRYKHSFPFEVVGGLDFPEGFFCNDIEESKDKFTNEITYRSPESEGISIIKVKAGVKVNTYLSIRVGGSTVNVKEKGVILLLDNKLKITKPDAELDVDVNTSKYGSGYIYSAFIDLNINDIKLLTQNKITDVRLYIYDNDITDGKKISEYLKCIIKK
jgi:hypothetical protein